MNFLILLFFVPSILASIMLAKISTTAHISDVKKENVLDTSQIEKKEVKTQYTVKKTIKKQVAPVKKTFKTVKPVITANTNGKKYFKTLNTNGNTNANTNGTYKSSSIDQLLVKHFGKSAPQAKKIMLCESGGNPSSINDNSKTRDYSIGLFQVNLYGNLKNTRPKKDWLLVAENNIKYASQLHGWHGWKPWTNCARKHGLL